MIQRPRGTSRSNDPFDLDARLVRARQLDEADGALLAGDDDRDAVGWQCDGARCDDLVEIVERLAPPTKQQQAHGSIVARVDQGGIVAGERGDSLSKDLVKLDERVEMTFEADEGNGA